MQKYIFYHYDSLLKSIKNFMRSGKQITNAIHTRDIENMPLYNKKKILILARLL